MVTKIKIMNLLKIKKEAEEMKFKDFSNFSEYFTLYQEKLEPVSDWAFKCFDIARNLTNKSSQKSLYNHLATLDNTCSVLFDLPKKKEKKLYQSITHSMKMTILK